MLAASQRVAVNGRRNGEAADSGVAASYHNCVSNYTEPEVPRGRVPSTVREVLEDARVAQEDFGDCWPVAVGHALGQVGNLPERKRWRRALEATRERWRAAYEFEEPDRLELALSFVGSERGVRVPDKQCERCGAEVLRKQPWARFCSTNCQRLYGESRRRMAA
jgi:hypothetical protein